MQNDMQGLLGNIKIPPQPEIVRALMEERARDEPDINRIIRLIGQDAGLAAAVLKTVNSPFYALRNKVASIQQAVSMLGLKNVGSLVMGLALRNSVRIEGIERFWESTSRSAQIGHLLARHLGHMQPQEAHLYVLLHDAAMPLLVQNLPDYRQTMHDLSGMDWCGITELEDIRHNTNHAVVGGLLARNWGLPEHVSEAITNHHDLTVMEDARLPHEALTLIAIGHVAEKLEAMIADSMNDAEWDTFGEICMHRLSLCEDEMLDLKDTAKNYLGIGEF